jgi:septum site-determining protein MinD
MLAITGGKGGSGKTTTALGLAAALVRQGENPIVVDCDCDMPDLHHLLHIDRADGIDTLARGGSIAAACQSSTTVPGVRSITAGDRSNVDTALTQLADWHDTVILDCPPGTGPDAVRPLRHARQTLVVSTDQPQSLADAQTTAHTAREVGTDVAGLLVRKTSGSSQIRWSDESPLLARVDSVETPLSNPQIRARWSRLAQQLPTCRGGIYQQDRRGRH